MTIFRHGYACLLTTFAGAAALATPADARSVSATAGRSVSNGDAGCINELSYGTLNNGCGRNVTIEVPLVADGSPPDEVYDVTITARGEISPRSTVGCWAYGFANSGGTVYWYSSGSARFLPILGVATEVTVSTYVPPFGALIVDCQLEAGATLIYVNWK